MCILRPDACQSFRKKKRGDRDLVIIICHSKGREKEGKATYVDTTHRNEAMFRDASNPGGCACSMKGDNWCIREPLRSSLINNGGEGGGEVQKLPVGCFVLNSINLALNRLKVAGDILLIIKTFRFLVISFVILEENIS